VVRPWSGRSCATDSFTTPARESEGHQEISWCGCGANGQITGKPDPLRTHLQRHYQELLWSGTTGFEPATLTLAKKKVMRNVQKNRSTAMRPCGRRMKLISNEHSLPSAIAFRPLRETTGPPPAAAAGLSRTR